MSGYLAKHRMVMSVILLGLAVIAVATSWGIRTRRQNVNGSADDAHEMAHLLDLAGRHIDPFRASNDQVTVFLFTRTDCPISNRYAPEVRRLYEKFSSLGVLFWLVYVDPDESLESIRQHIEDYSYPCEALRDLRHELVKLTKARVTPEAAVFAPARLGQAPTPADSGQPSRMVYRGRIDDQYVDFGKARPVPTTRDLEQVLEALLEGRPVRRTTTSAVGCYISDLQ